MKTTSFRLHRLSKLVLGSALMLFWASTPAEAIVITNVEVAIGSYLYKSGTCAATVTSNCVGWTFPRSLSPGEDLVLTQMDGYNFDTSDQRGPLDRPVIRITADGKTKTFHDLEGVLNVKGIDSSIIADNEAQEYGLAFNGPGYKLFLGYADNVHIRPCGEWASSIGLKGSPTCFPSPFFGATYFYGAGALNPGLPQVNPFHCSDNLPDCYDAGVIRIVATEAPEPATMALLLTGIAFVGARQYRRTRKQA